MTDKSPFKKLFADRQQLEPVTPEPKSEPVPAAHQKQRGRPKGKRSDPNFEQVTAYIRKTTHQQVKIALLQDGQGREFSELVEELLAAWLKSRS